MAFLHFPDLDSITLDDLSLGSTVPVMGDPALIIREYLHPGQQHGGQNMQGRDHRLKVIASSIHTQATHCINAGLDCSSQILEPREEMVSRSVIKHTNTEFSSKPR